MVTTAHDAKPDAHAAAGGMRLVMIDQPERRRAPSAVARQLPLAARSRLSARDAGPGAHSVIRYFEAAREAGERTRQRLAAAHRVVALLAARPQPAERLRRIGGRRGDESICSGAQAGVREAGGDRAARESGPRACAGSAAPR